MDGKKSFSHIAGGAQHRKPTTDFSGDDFPALGAQKTQTREEILMSNLLGNTSASIGSAIMTPGNMDLNSKAPGVSFGSQFKDFTPTKVTSDSKNEFGLLGLIDVIRMANPDLSMLSLGCDLTTLGLDLNASDNIYSNFMTPFTENPTQGADPSFTISNSYAFKKPIPPALSKVSVFTDETLLYIFYAMPRDVLQEAAAQELYKRNWRFHKEFRLWLTKEDPNSEPVAKGADFERGHYIFFDPSSWTKVKKEWILYFDQLEERSASPDNTWAKTGSIFESNTMGSLDRNMKKMAIKDRGFSGPGKNTT